MFYSIRHITKYHYSAPISESLTEVRMQPRTENHQRCLTFQLSLSPRARVFSLRDHFQNTVHHFDVPSLHNRLMIVAEALVDVQPPPPLPYSLPPDSWQELDAAIADGDYWDMLMPSRFAKPTPLLNELQQALNAVRRDDPLRLLRELNTSVFHWFDYVPKSTRVDSPIDDALRARAGVCQDFAHIMTALVRGLRIPCRYVSGYLFHGDMHRDRSSEGASHAWVEAFLPGLGWTGFDPTNNLLAGERHIRVAVGRDYVDVPPTRGVFRGDAESELSVGVTVVPSEQLPPPVEEMTISQEDWSVFLHPEEELVQQQQQQQQ
jgi:transglutaminase-like putative cysteine protease